MDIVHLYIPSFAGGGAERIFVRLANHFAGSGLRTRFIVNRRHGPLQDLLSDKVELVELSARRSRNALGRLTQFLRREKPGLVVVGLTFNNLTALLACLLSRSSAKLVICERNQLSFVLAQSNPLRRLAVHGLIRLLYPRAHAVTAVSGGVAKDVARIAGIPLSEITVIPNPPPDEQDIASARAAAPPHPWFAEQGPVIVAIGRLVRQKRYDILIEALAQVRQTKPARLIILGEGPEQAALTALAQTRGVADTVHFTGFAMNRLDYLVRADLYVLSSEYEGFPNALIEAIACLVPVVSTDCAGEGPREILGPSLEHALVPVNDPAALAERMVAELQAPVAAEALEAIARRYSLQSAADHYLRLAT
ncbi:glycosyltransferase [Bosea caraganae]|uniref:glycosyltransferase n=1 Tax=Bosea caraganae TaxID=2763117 RepID=UPI0011C030AF|nr:glycosyltransferase [Bosea caraganae]